MRTRGAPLSVGLAFGAACYFGVLYHEHQSAFHDLYSSQTNDKDDDDDDAWSLRSLKDDFSARNLFTFGSSSVQTTGAQQPPVVRQKKDSVLPLLHLHSPNASNPQTASLISNTNTKKQFLPVGYRPPKNTVLDDNKKVIGDVKSLIQFAVIGFGKCGTTSIISWLDQHPELITYSIEIYDMMFGRVGDVVEKMYTLQDGPYKRGYKSPADLAFMDSVNSLRIYFPETKLIFGIRHPVLWFQSLYNFRVQNLNSKDNHDAFPRPNELIGPCYKTRKNTCTHKGEFGLHIRNLGKTLAAHNTRRNSDNGDDDSNGPYELTLLEQRLYDTSHTSKPYPNIQHAAPNPVFLFEINQLSDTNATRTSQFRSDMTEFLELNSPLPPMLHKKPGRTWKHNQDLQAVKDSLKIDICADEHLPTRRELMRMARSSSIWIREYFLDPVVLQHAGVYVSSPDHLKSLLQDWMVDPCGDDKADDAGKEYLDLLSLDRRRRAEKKRQEATAGD